MVNNLVDKMGAKMLWRLLTGNSQSTQQLFTELLTAASHIERTLKSEVHRSALKSTVAAVWECVRYGWQQSAFGRKADPKATLGEIHCRRTKVLMRRAVKCGAEIAHRQATGGA